MSCGEGHVSGRGKPQVQGVWVWKVSCGLRTAPAPRGTTTPLARHDQGAFRGQARGGARRGWRGRNSQQLAGTTVSSKASLPGSEEACLHGSPLWSLLLNMPSENDAQWDVCTFVITKTGLVFHNLCLLISPSQEGK